MHISIRAALAMLAIMSAMFLPLGPAVQAAPIGGAIFEVPQPDGTMVRVRIWGDEFYQHVESLDGYTLVRDPKTHWIYYAQLNRDGTDLVSTGVVYRDGLTNQLLLANGQVLHKGLKPSQAAIAEQVKTNWKLLNPGTTAAPRTYADSQVALQGNVLGLVLLIDFPDVKSSIPKAEIDRMFNQVGYTNYGNNGSIRDYYYDVSSGNLTYTNYISDFYTARNPRSYYTNPSRPYGEAARELIIEAMRSLDSRGFDFSTLTTNANRTVLAINAFYAGNISNSWSQGLWPHQGQLSFSADGVNMRSYQITNIGTQLSIFTTAHENGHMLGGWADTYDYQSDSRGAGHYDLMSYTGPATNPPPPNPAFRLEEGWGTSTRLNDFANLSRVDVRATNLNPYRWASSAANEFFLVENIRRTGRWANIPDEGLLIWHIDMNGNNSYQDMTPSRHYMVSVEQADGLYDLERNRNSGGANDLFHGGYKDQFNASTTPNSNWWSGAASGFSISNIGPVGDIISFTLHKQGGPTATPVRTPTPTTSTPTRTPTPITVTPTPITVTPTPGAAIFTDDFETNKGWTVNAGGSDTATLGQWERGDPEPTDYNGSKQLGTTTSGLNDLVTGRLAGSSAGAYDIDGGLSSIRSPSITLPPGSNPSLSFNYYLAHADNGGSDDYFRVKVIGSSTSTVFEKLGAATDLDAAWQSVSVNLSTFAGQSVQIQIEAADLGTGSLLEAAVDDLRISASTTSTPTPTTPTPVTPSPTTGPSIVYMDTFESSTGWMANANGSDTATLGQWERGDPEATDYEGPKQLGTTTSGLNDLVTGRLAGSSVGAYDLDGGLSSIRSPSITLPSSGNLSLSFNYYLAHANNAGSDDSFRIKIVGSSGTTTVFERLGAATDLDAAWQTGTVNLSSYAGQSIHILIEAADLGTGSLLEAAIDDLSISRQ